ncbi:unnamed protein product [Urochloa decumbens]|uniref:AAA+ ATPase domain-containing protein n=1 Tax=Urochloa decumbens TaxID=240449 RepID=A0ABC9FD55_9POAL
MDLSTVLASPSYAKAADAYKKAVATAATLTAYTVLVRGVARELVPYELRAEARWAVSAVRDRLTPPPKPRRTKTIFIGRYGEGSGNAENRFFWDARATTTRRLCLTFADSRQMLSMVPGDSMTDVFEGVEFTWTLLVPQAGPPCSLMLSFDAEHMELALKIFMNERCSWEGIKHHHPATFDTVAMDPALKQSIIADLDRFLGRREYCRRIGKAWKRGYLLYGPPGTGKSSLVAAMANYLRFNLYDLDLSHAGGNRGLQKLLTAMPNKSILVIEDIDCCFKSREGTRQRTSYGDGDDSDESDQRPPRTSSYELQRERIALSGMLNFIDGLWSTSGEERIIVFTTNYKERLDPALLRPGRMDMHIYMGYCCWEVFKTLAKNYFLLDNQELFPEIQELLSRRWM